MGSQHIVITGDDILSVRITKTRDGEYFINVDGRNGAETAEAEDWYRYLTPEGFVAALYKRNK